MKIEITNVSINYIDVTTITDKDPQKIVDCIDVYFNLLFGKAKLSGTYISKSLKSIEDLEKEIEKYLTSQI